MNLGIITKLEQVVGDRVVVTAAFPGHEPGSELVLDGSYARALKLGDYLLVSLGESNVHAKSSHE